MNLAAWVSQLSLVIGTIFVTGKNRRNKTRGVKQSFSWLQRHSISTSLKLFPYASTARQTAMLSEEAAQNSSGQRFRFLLLS